MFASATTINNDSRANPFRGFRMLNETKTGEKKNTMNWVSERESAFVLLSSVNPLINGFLDGKLAIFFFSSPQRVRILPFKLATAPIKNNTNKTIPMQQLESSGKKKCFVKICIELRINCTKFQESSHMHTRCMSDHFICQHRWLNKYST